MRNEQFGVGQSSFFIRIISFIRQLNGIKIAKQDYKTFLASKTFDSFFLIKQFYIDIEKIRKFEVRQKLKKVLIN